MTNLHSIPTKVSKDAGTGRVLHVPSAASLPGGSWPAGTGQGRTGQGRMRTGQAAFLGFSPSDILVDRTRVSALLFCPISQRTFVWLNFLA